MGRRQAVVKLDFQFARLGEQVSDFAQPGKVAVLCVRQDLGAFQDGVEVRLVLAREFGVAVPVLARSSTKAGEADDVVVVGLGVSQKLAQGLVPAGVEVVEAGDGHEHSGVVLEVSRWR